MHWLHCQVLSRLNRMAHLIFVWLLQLCLHLSASSDDFVPSAHLDNGFVILGTRYTGESEITYDRYLGIPYAKPPIGPLRFKPPQPYEWNGDINAFNEGNACVQIDTLEKKGPMGNEDCLYLNVFTPVTNTNRTSLLPVMVWIYGGGFNWGSSQLNVYTPDYFMDENVIIVSFNYRIGPLGFLNIGECSISGNMGLKDQTMALKWVQNNIKAFGGDPSMVTIFGESAGGASVHFHLLSEYSKGLFSRAISESGSALNNFAWDYHPRENAIKLANALNYSSEVHGSLTEFFLTINPMVLTGMSFYILPPKDQALVPYVFFPSVENNECNDVFFSTHPSNLMNCCSPNNQIPLLMGLNKDEGILSISLLIQYAALYNMSFYENIESNYARIIPPRLLDYLNATSTNKIDEIWERMREFYLDNKTHYTSADDLKLIQMNGDGWFAYDVWISAKRESERRNVFFYFFTTEGAPGIFTKQYNVNYNGTNHGDELGYLFSGDLHNECYSRKPKPQMDCKTYSLALSKKFISAWVNFARTGVPREDWPTFRGCNTWPCYMNINKKWVVESGEPLRNRTCFWDKLYQEVRERTPSTEYRFRVQLQHNV